MTKDPPPEYTPVASTSTAILDPEAELPHDCQKALAPLSVMMQAKCRDRRLNNVIAERLCRLTSLSEAATMSACHAKRSAITTIDLIMQTRIRQT